MANELQVLKPECTMANELQVEQPDDGCAQTDKFQVERVSLLM